MTSPDYPCASTDRVEEAFTSDSAIDMGDYRADRPVVLASSGGADSLGALARLVQLRREGLIGPLSVLSVNHQLHPDAGFWSDLAVRQARHFGLAARRIDIRVPDHGSSSLEARARTARYAALADCLPKEGVLVTAHHADDQAETFLLAALRGAGPTGLAAMPAWTRFAVGWHWRPFLKLPRAELRAWAASTGLEWVEDPSNADTRFDRNYLRHEVLPLLALRWPGVTDRLTVAAGLQADALALTDDLAEIDARRCVSVSTASDSSPGDAIELIAFRRLSPGRQINLLRFWLRQHGLDLPTAAQLETLRRQLQDEASSAARLDWAGGSLRRYRQMLYLLPPDHLSGLAIPLRDWPERVDRLSLADGRVLQRVLTSGAHETDLDRQASAGVWRLRGRQPGDRIRPAATGVSRDLKHWFQERGVPPWWREQAVVLEVDGRLAALSVAGHWVVDAAFQAESGAPAWALHWQDENAGWGNEKSVRP